jgi:hypothetical protein
MKRKYYKIITDGNDKEGGTLYAPPQWSYPIARDGVEVKNWKSLVLELKNGYYCSFHTCNKGANLVSQDLKDVLESFVGNHSEVEFLPVMVTSKEYGDRTYYILHFRLIFDVIDKKNTIYFDGLDTILKMKLDYEKVKTLNVFNSRPAVNDIIVSKDVHDAIKQRKLTSGLDFVPVFCGNG